MGVLMVNMEQHNPGYRGLWGLLAYPAIFMAFLVVPPNPERKRKIFTVVRVIGFAALAVLALVYRTADGKHLILGPIFDQSEPLFDESLWPPNHGYVVFSTDDMASATDACGEVTLSVSGCASSQPEEVHQGSAPDGGNGDGRTFEDCVWEEAGSEFAARAERLGACGKESARLYSVEITATDECGNSASAVGLLRVAHDRSDGRPVLRGRGLKRNDPLPWPYVHDTTYGEDCGPGR